MKSFRLLDRCRLRAAVFSMALALGGCASAPLALRIPTHPRPESTCEYFTLYVEFENLFVGPQGAEGVRRQVLLVAAEFLSERGFWLVGSRQEAYWRLGASSWEDGGRPRVRFGLEPNLKLARHMFVVMMEEGFPYRGELGAGYLIAFSRSGVWDWVVRAFTQQGVEWIWAKESEQLLALCEKRDELVAEGWVEIEELRERLVVEMKRIRRQRLDEVQVKSLRVEGEEPE